MEALRGELYPRLASVANQWNEAMGIDARFPASHEEYLGICDAAGQTKPTPLLLQYEAGDYNCLHQDVYGDLLFPLQAAFLLSRPAADFTGGRVFADGTAPADAIEGGGGVAGTERWGDLRSAAASGARGEGVVPGEPAEWREPGAERGAAYAWHHLSRCTVMGARDSSHPRHPRSVLCWQWSAYLPGAGSGLPPPVVSARTPSDSTPSLGLAARLG